MLESFGSLHSEDRIDASLPLFYYFIHNAERRDTKQFRAGQTTAIGRYSVVFEAQIVDPSILPSAIEGDILIAVRIRPDSGPTFDATGRLLGAEPATNGKPGHYKVAVEYTEADLNAREAIWNLVSSRGA